MVHTLRPHHENGLRRIEQSNHDQIAAIHTHRGDSERVRVDVHNAESYSTAHRALKTMQPTTRPLQRTVYPCAARNVILPRMITKPKTLLLSVLVLLSSAAVLQSATPPASGPEYTSDAELKFPEHYRDWMYLTTGFDMSYNPGMAMDHHMFDNVFVNPESYKAFVETGTWPDKTMLVLEARGAEGKGSINQRGNFQGTDVMGVEVT